MRYVTYILILAWSIYTLKVNGDVKPSENFFLWFLSISSMLYSFIMTIIMGDELHDFIKSKMK